MRTHPDHHFFEGGTLRRQSMERILFIYAKLNPGVRYVQGMNEVLGTIFYVLAEDPAQAKAFLRKAVLSPRISEEDIAQLHEMFDEKFKQ